VAEGEQLSDGVALGVRTATFPRLRIIGIGAAGSHPIIAAATVSDATSKVLLAN